MPSWIRCTASLALVLVGCTGPREPGGAADLVASLPGDVDLVTFVDLADLRDHPLWSQLQNDEFISSGEPPLERLRELTGLNPREDLHMVLFVAQGLGQPDFRLSLFARGDLDRQQLEALFDRGGLVQETRDGLEIFLLPDTGAGGLGEASGGSGLEDACLAFLDDFTLGFGSPALLAQAASVREGSTPSVLDDPDLGPLIREGLGSGQFWGVFRSGFLADQLRDRIETGIPLVGVLRGFSGVRLLRFTLRFSNSIDLVARTRTGTEEEARLLADTLNGFLALAKLLAKDQPEVLRFLEGTLVGLDLDSVRLSMNIDSGTLDRIQEGLFRNLGGPDTSG